MEKVKQTQTPVGKADPRNGKKPYVKPAVVDEVTLSSYSLGCLGRLPCNPIQVPKGT